MASLLRHDGADETAACEVFICCIECRPMSRNVVPRNDFTDSFYY